MPTYAVTGATGHLGRLVVAELLTRGIEPGAVVAIARTPAKAADLAEQGVQVRAGDYDEPDTLTSALSGVDTLLLVSGSEVGRRIAQHRAVIDAAKANGVGRIAYTSLLRADTSAVPLAPEHKATEEMLRASGITFTMLRNSWYIENYTAQIDQYLKDEVIVAAAGDGRIAAATRADYAAAAAAALTGTGHDNAVYELGGTPFTFADLANVIADVTGTKVSYQAVTPTELVQRLMGMGLDKGMAEFVAALDEGIARGELDTDATDLETLIGRPSTPLADAVRAARRSPIT